MQSYYMNLIHYHYNGNYINSYVQINDIQPAGGALKSSKLYVEFNIGTIAHFYYFLL